MTIIIACGATQVDFDTLPEASRQYLAQKAANHLFANVLDSKVAGKIEASALEAYNQHKAADAPAWGKLAETDRKARVTAMKSTYSDESLATMKAALAAETLQSLRDGTMATRASAVRKSPEAKIREEIIMGYIRAGAESAKAKGRTVKIPTGAELTAMMEKVAQAKAADIEKELKVRLARTTKAAEGLDDLFG